ncbi:MAG: glycosyltransferase family 4 protein, partial [Burkholderiales bacterium]
AMQSFSAQLSATQGRHDLMIGFQKLQGLDLLFCADWCYVEGPRPRLATLLPRYRTMAALERACFAPEARTRILLLSEPQRAAYAAAYRTPAERMTVLPPTVDRSHHSLSTPTADEHAALRVRHGIPPASTVWLWVGLQPQVKGLDRAIAALSKHPQAVLLISGLTPSDRALAAPLAQAWRNGVADRVLVQGVMSVQGLNDLFELSDLLVHPARLDVTGTVILEALAHGLPVITTANCGFSVHVTAADAGIVLPVPFEQNSFERALNEAGPERRARWAHRALSYCADPMLYSGIDRACELIENAARVRAGVPSP